MSFLLVLYLVTGFFLTLVSYSQYSTANFKFLRSCFIGFGWPIFLAIAILLVILAAFLDGYTNEKP